MNQKQGKGDRCLFVEKARIRRQSYEESKYLLFNTSRKMVDFKKKNKEEQNLLSQLEILELLVQDRESIIAAAQPGGTYMPGIQNNF